MMKNFTTFQKELSDSQKNAILTHFNEIYECTELKHHEMKMIFLAYLWKNGQIAQDQDGFVCMLGEHGVDLFEDYEITFEGGEGNEGGVNLNLFYDYYSFEKMMLII